jgi:hypothetical protein
MGKKAGKQLSFTTTLRKIGSWTIAPATIDVYKWFGTRQYVRVKGLIDHVAFESKSLMPRGDGTHFLAIDASIRKAIKKQSGDEVRIVIEEDKAELQIPSEITEALEYSEEAKKVFSMSSQGDKRIYCKHISSGRSKETREKRAADLVIRLERIYLEKRSRYDQK